MQIALFLKQLKLFGKKENVQVGKKTMDLLAATVTSIDELIDKALINDAIVGENVDFLFNLDAKHFELRPYIICRLCPVRNKKKYFFAILCIFNVAKLGTNFAVKPRLQCAFGKTAPFS